MAAKTPAAGKAAPAAKKKPAAATPIPPESKSEPEVEGGSKPPSTETPVGKVDQMLAGAPASDAKETGTPEASAPGDAPGTVAPQGETSPSLGTTDGEIHSPEGDKAKVADPATPPEPTHKFKVISGVDHDGEYVGPGGALALTQIQFEALKAIDAVEGVWPTSSA